jgi:serine/threonine-protein kinase RsbW
MSNTPLGAIEVEASMDNWDLLIEFVSDAIHEYLPDKSRDYNLRLAYEELISNIIRSSGEDSQKQSESLLEVTSWLRDQDGHSWFVIRTADTGTRFDPEFGKRNPVDTTQHVNDRAIGGLGLFLIEKSVDKATYQWANNRNINELWMECVK